MKELNDIIAAYDQSVLQKKRTALVTVVEVQGSSYRRPGARMLVTEDGEITGAISGGCLEGDALRKAQSAMYRQQNRLEIYDTTDEEDHNLGVQLGCNGIVYILFEPIVPGHENNPIHLLKKTARERKAALLVTVFNRNKNAAQTGTCYFLNENEAVSLEEGNVGMEALRTLQQKRSVVQTGADDSVLYQFIPPPIQLLIVGAGNDVQPLADMAFLLGWKIVVLDGRPAYATPQRFPKADKTILSKSADILSAVRIDEQTAVVLMTHNYNYDVAALEQFLRTDCPYIGVLGPRKKLHKMLDELATNGIDIPADALHKIHGPVGLDIGAETSEEIALSILAEIKAVFSKRRGGSLRERRIEIHERPLLPQHE
jgi:xanthine/CO dehydrogenase XdhC/CoxF family maturation factor